MLYSECEAGILTPCWAESNKDNMVTSMSMHYTMMVDAAHPGALLSLILTPEHLITELTDEAYLLIWMQVRPHIHSHDTV